MEPDGKTNGVTVEKVEAATKVTAEKETAVPAGKTETAEPADKTEATRPVIYEHTDAKIVKQLEYYFSDTNLPYDKFLQNEIKIDDGWVKIVVLLTFKRLAAISDNKAVIAAAVKKSPNTILEVDETNEKIRRKPDHVVPVANSEFLNDMIERSVYCKGFSKTTTMDELLDFAATFGDNTITKVTPRRLKNKEFKGSLYFTFNTKEQADIFLKQASVKYNNVELERKWEKDFLIEKKKEYDEKIAKKDEKIRAETEKYFKKGYLLKVDNVNANTSVDKIKELCSSYDWQVAFVKIVDEEKIAWIRLKPVALAKDLLEAINCEKNDLNVVFSLPEEEIEQTILNEMTKEMKSVLNMKDKIKREKNKNKGKRFNKRKNDEGDMNNKRVKTNEK